ncbi:MAG: hypothetical protein JXA30_14085 [Deltaproteobacteria bacterium]|nr:hypothetical protein [Deltaproteobacteria bacterium]
MKRLTYFGLVALLVSANALFVIGCGCDDDDDENGDKSGADANGEADDSAVAEEDAEVGTDATADAKNTGVSEKDAAADTGTETPVYECGGDEAECDLLDDESCGEGKGCQFLTPSSGDEDPFAQCVDVGEGQAGEACDDDNLCAAGFDCNGGFCHKYCCTLGSTVQCPTDQACVIEVLGQDQKSTGVYLCDECVDCNPLTAEGCEAGQGCYPIPSSDKDTGCRLCLVSSEKKEEGDACDSANDCKPGLGCYSINEEAPACTSFCDLTADSDPCEPDGRCTGELIGEASMDETVGLCVPKS